MAAEAFDVKLQFLAKQLAWLCGMFLILPICLWGTFLSWQYRHDVCVKGNVYYLALDWWLMTVSLYTILSAIIMLGMLCCHFRGRARRCVGIPLHVGNIVLNALGIALIVLSEANGIGCDHNELWVFSIVIVSLTFGIALILVITGVCMKAGLCSRLKRWMMDDEEVFKVYVPDETFSRIEEEEVLFDTDGVF